MKWNIAVCIGLPALTLCLDAAAHSGGVSIARELGRRVAAGMSCEDVKTNLGRPATDFRFGAAPGPTWTYYIEGLPPGTHHFEVAFDERCMVVSTAERFTPAGG